MPVTLVNIYKGTITSANSDVSITSVNASKSVVFISCRQDENTNATDHWQHCTPHLVSDTILRIQKAGGGQTIDCEYIILEFSSGVDVQWIKTAGAASTNKDFTISTVNLAQSWVLAGIAWGQSSWGTTNSDYWKFTSTTNVRAVTGGTSTNDAIIQVVDWDGAIVQSADITLAGTSDTDTITAVDQTKALIIASQQAGGADQVGQWDFSNNTTVRSTRTATNSRDAHYFVIELDEIQVQRGSDGISGTSGNIAITAVSDTSQSFAFWMNYGGMSIADNGAASLQAFAVRLKFNSTTEINAARYSSSGGDADFAWMVFEFVGTPLQADLTPTLQMSYMA